MRFSIMTVGLVVALLVLGVPFSASAAEKEAVFRAGSKPSAKNVVIRSESRPPQDKPRGSVSLGRPGRPNYDFDKPGRNRPGRPDRDRDRDRYDGRDRDRDRYDGRDRDRNRDRYGDRDRRPGWDNRPGRYDGRDLSRGANCYPYCYGGVWPWGGDGNDDDDDEERRLLGAAPPAEPERGFQGGGTFERFDDPRLNPPDAANYPPALGGGPDVPPQPAVDQYQMMMKA
ncbi:MAG: hypothetical protein LBV79_09935, partial [Candidatus Adiutrix sp.]|jgi:hypothetical protein|nr:hypothetical protein [Candidatus Adiutrix sp.]